MSKGLNKVMLLGNVGKDPEVKYTQDGRSMARFSIATSEEWKDKASGEKKEKTEWHKVVFWGPLAEVVGKYVKKGNRIYVEGKIETRTWDQDGEKKYIAEIIGRELLLLGGKNVESGEDAPAPEKPAPITDDDMPF
jgi:single-strand DNA-binding protein